jgi:hypothetical protein
METEGDVEAYDDSLLIVEALTTWLDEYFSALRQCGIALNFNRIGILVSMYEPLLGSARAVEKCKSILENTFGGCFPAVICWRTSAMLGWKYENLLRVLSDYYCSPTLRVAEIVKST